MGDPSFDFIDGIYRITAPTDSDRGIWTTLYTEPLTYGQELKISGSVRTTAPGLRVSLVWIANQPGEQIHSVEHAVEIAAFTPMLNFEPFEYTFNVPDGVKLLRVDLRGRAGAGLYEFRDIDITPTGETPEEPKMLVTSIVVGQTRWRITCTEDAITFYKLVHEPLANSKVFWLE